MSEIPDHLVEIAGKAVNDAFRERARIPAHVDPWESLQGEPRDACLHAGRLVLASCWDEITAHIRVEVERAAVARAREEAANEIDNADDPEQFKSRTEEAPLGWTNESIETALMASGVITDWLRTRASEIREEEA